ncbi:amino acid racemase [Candidatus Saccharibacteria bacterium]|nr:amino acid racemase [Candidatus Saccharibacteria bacterium]
MKRIGIIAGLSPETTPKYCTGIDQYINRIKGGHSSADMIIRTGDFDVYYDLMQKGSWDYISHLICEEATILAGCHCTYVAIASNTMHKIADEVELAVECDPERFHEFVHIGDAIANKCQRFGAKRVAVLGTKVTMTEDFLKKRLRKNGLKVVDGFTDNTIAEVDRIIFDELCYGKVYDSSMKFLQGVCQDFVEIQRRRSEPLDAIILGCTELNMLIDNQFSYWLYKTYGCCIVDSTQAHIERLAELSLHGDDDLVFP